ncbi:hypothetical protein QBC35DRAFT_384064 [Podospora australis]|uniref:RGS domain-containing protein n=1 Tax=Podospora australis TaxID=1536484 RepID=A0AAN6WWI1_9PEZI|nr:hypothetical protein QBC35DRAFT_384064 [Podospora australis]
MVVQIPSWLSWYKKPEYRDIKEYSAYASAGTRPLSPNPGGHNGCIPSRLKLDRILANKTCSPMSLYDFYMYLKYIEFSAENLEFYIWFKHYETAFAKGLTSVNDRDYGSIPSAQESMSSVDQFKRQNAMFNASVADKPDPLDEDSDSDPELAETLNRISALISADALCPRSGACPSPLTLTPDKNLNITACTSTSAPATLKLLNPGPITRHELDTVITLFLIPGAEKELNIPASLRSRALSDLQKSSDPAALKPIADHIYGLLRNCSHRNFVRLGVGNGTFETICVATIMGVLNLLAGYLVVLCRAFLPFRGANTRWEAFAGWPFWWLGLSLILSGLRGSCFFLLLFSRRQRLPWERFDDTESSLSNSGGFLTALSRLMIFDRRLRIKEKHLRMLQRKIVLQSLAGGSVFATIWVAVFIFLPVWKEIVR